MRKNQTLLSGVRLLTAVAIGLQLSAPLAGIAGELAPGLTTGATILFQGDSITDGAHGQEEAHLDHILGDGYVYLIAAQCGAHAPEMNLKFINRGHSGNTVGDMALRWQRDTLDSKPAIVSILIGVNDVWRNLHQNKPIPYDQIEATYDKLLADTITALPQAKIVLGEPFIVAGFETTPRWPEWSEGVIRLRAIVATLGTKYHVPVIQYQRLFDDACRRAPADHWIFDGVHPIASGHLLMAEEWLRVVNETWHAGLPQPENPKSGGK